MKKWNLITMMVFFLGFPNLASGFPAVEVYQKTSNAVVLIVAQMDSKDNMAGAGSIISRDGKVITNAHVVVNKKTQRPSSKIWVFLKPENISGDFQRDLVNRYKAEVLSFDNEFDLALLKIHKYENTASAIELANPNQILVGEEVVAIGHPEQGGLWSLTYGRISGTIANQSDIKGKDVFQTDASVNRGNSGGPLLDKRGYMVGVNTNIARVGAGGMAITGINFAVKASVVKNWLAMKGFKMGYGDEPLSYEEKVAPAQIEEKGSLQERESKAEVPEEEPKEEEITVRESTEPKPEKEEYGEEKAQQVPDADRDLREKAQDFEDKEMEEVDKLEDIPEDKILTRKRPYSFDELFSEVEKEMEDLMEQMKMKIRKK